MKTEQFNYHLPQSFIAQRPIEPRHNSKLLIYDRQDGSISQNIFREIGEYLHSGDLLVINKTKVLPARIFGNKDTGGIVEVLLLKKIGSRTWEALVGGKRLGAGKRISFTEGLFAEIDQVLERAKRVITFSEEIEPFLREIGEMPLPPYIHEELADQDRYQTVYAQAEGSAAAPTAGLHFTQELLTYLEENGITFAEITLHVGLDTFAPVNEDNIEDHHIHTEWCEIDQHVIDQIIKAKNKGGRVIAVGTTSVRTLESAFYKSQEPGKIRPFCGSTDLFITPGFEFQMIDAMITNFHLPKSTLLMLVSAFAGRENILEVLPLCDGQQISILFIWRCYVNSLNPYE